MCYSKTTSHFHVRYIADLTFVYVLSNAEFSFLSNVERDSEEKRKRTNALKDLGFYLLILLFYFVNLVQLMTS